MNKLEELLGEKIISNTGSCGGCIADSKIFTTEKGTYFVKSYSDNTGILLNEANGLKELRKAKAIRIPEIIAVDENYLVLEYIEQSSPKGNFFGLFGRQFAKLHKYCADDFGFCEDNYVGSSRQINTPLKTSWTEFYWENRMLFQFRLAEKNGSFSGELKKYALKLEEKIKDILAGCDDVPASILHGDLWSGNFIADKQNSPILIDPAVYYGHREADLAMTKLFGGFTRLFYNAYNEEYPLEDGYEYRENIYILYHVLNHLNIFGSSYYNHAVKLLKSYF